MVLLSERNSMIRQAGNSGAHSLPSYSTVRDSLKDSPSPYLSGSALAGVCGILDYLEMTSPPPVTSPLSPTSPLATSPTSTAQSATSPAQAWPLSNLQPEVSSYLPARPSPAAVQTMPSTQSPPPSVTVTSPTTIIYHPQRHAYLGINCGEGTHGRTVIDIRSCQNDCKGIHHIQGAYAPFIAGIHCTPASDRDSVDAP